MKSMKLKKVKYDSVKLAILRKKYEIDTIIDKLIGEISQFEFEQMRMYVLFELEELKALEKRTA